jgi:hypothetical protein
MAWIEGDKGTLLVVRQTVGQSFGHSPEAK